MNDMETIAREMWKFVRNAGESIGRANEWRDQVVQELIVASSNGSLGKLISGVQKDGANLVAIKILGNPVNVLFQVTFQGDEMPVRISFFDGGVKENSKPFYVARALHYMVGDLRGVFDAKGLDVSLQYVLGFAVQEYVRTYLSWEA
ncbi:hypothetical protein [Chromobacterium sp.]|uniref:hypothetical protein n=1 Tax=Chromobacterium sp. TaxID=306190 RepID=UPI0035ADF7FD